MELNTSPLQPTLICVLLLLLVMTREAQAQPTNGVAGAVPAGTLQRTSTKQVLAALNTPNNNNNGGAIPANANTNNVANTALQTATQVFMTSQSRTFTGLLVRKQTSGGGVAGGLGTDYCYVDVINTASQASIWESPCKAVSTTSPCILLLDDNGLAIADGNNNEVWNNGAGRDYVNMVLLENGDLRMLDSQGNSIWSAFDSPLVNQNCGSVLKAGSPPFINPPFSSPLQAQLPNGQNLFSQPFASANPLVSSAPLTSLSSLAFCFLLVPALVFHFCCV